MAAATDNIERFQCQQDLSGESIRFLRVSEREKQNDRSFSDLVRVRETKLLGEF